MEDNMGQVNTMIGNLRNMALDMGSELENQNRMIERINAKVNSEFPFLRSALTTILNARSKKAKLSKYPLPIFPVAHKLVI